MQQNEVTDSAYLGSESTYSECETFTDEDTGALVPPEMHEDVETDSGIEATLHDPEDGANRLVQIGFMLHWFSTNGLLGSLAAHWLLAYIACVRPYQSKSIRARLVS